MDVKTLSALVAVADTGSVTKAARLLHLAQPAVSRHIRTLEDDVGVELFERSRSGMSLTPSGTLLVERARRVLLELERARAEMRPDLRSIAGVVTLGLLESTIEVLAPPLVSAIHDKHPDIDLRVVSAYSGHLQSWLDDGAIDLTLLYDLRATPSIAVTPLLQEPLWALAPPTEELSSPHLTWASLAERALILPVAGHGLRVLIDDAFSGLGLTPVSICQTDSMSLQKAFVASGQGWTVLPASGAAHDVASGRLNGRTLFEPTVSRTVALALQRTPRTPPAVAAVATEVVRVTRRVVRSGGWATARIVDEHESPTG